MKVLLNRIADPLKKRADAESFGIVEFLKFAAKQIKPSEIILDAGAGDCKYRKYFNHAKYISTDFDFIFDEKQKNIHDFICDLHNMPKPDNYFDSIICTQVLEHVEYPQKVVNEFYRVLKPNGKLFLTAPQGWGLHGEPYHFFNFTKYGLDSIFKNAGLEIIFIKPRGGIFWFIGKILRILPDYLYNQQCGIKGKSALIWKKKVIFFVLLPVTLVLKYLIPLFFFYLDRFDKRQAWTLGYACYCIKKPKT